MIRPRLDPDGAWFWFSLHFFRVHCQIVCHVIFYKFHSTKLERIIPSTSPSHLSVFDNYNLDSRDPFSPGLRFTWLDIMKSSTSDPSSAWWFEYPWSAPSIICRVWLGMSFAKSMASSNGTISSSEPWMVMTLHRKAPWDVKIIREKPNNEGRSRQPGCEIFWIENNWKDELGTWYQIEGVIRTDEGWMSPGAKKGKKKERRTIG